MKLRDEIKIKTIELLKNYKDVIYSHNEIIKITSNCDQNMYLSKELPLDSKIEEIKNRFEELDKDNYIDAVKLVFNVKPLHKRSYMKKEIYYKIIQ